MRMPADHFAVDGFEGVGDVEVPGLGGHLRKEDDLQQQVAELLGELLPIARVDCVEDLVGFFEQVRLDGIEGLFAVPRAAAGSPQPRHDFHQPGKACGSGQGLGRRLWGGHGNLRVALWNRLSSLAVTVFS